MREAFHIASTMTAGFGIGHAIMTTQLPSAWLTIAGGSIMCVILGVGSYRAWRAPQNGDKC